MNKKADSKAIVTVLDNVESAHSIVEKLQAAGFPLEKIELVTHDIHEEAPQVESSFASETTTDVLINSAGRGAALGAVTGLVAAVLAPFPGVGLAMIAMGGIVGGAVGGIAGIEHTLDDDEIDLPKLEEYERLVDEGHVLVVVLGSHDEVHCASDIIQHMPYIHSHIHPVGGREVHEHPSH